MCLIISLGNLHQHCFFLYYWMPYSRGTFNIANILFEIFLASTLLVCALTFNCQKAWHHKNMTYLYMHRMSLHLKGRSSIQLSKTSHVLK
ncbi:hypothetical protein AMTRI_Chr09g13510 [Amborella trichopoda]